MTTEEFFIKQFNKCTWIEDDESTGNIFMVYDKHHERKIKMNSILGNDKEIKFIKTEDTITLFYQDHENGYLDCNYDEVWSVFVDKYRLKYNEIKELIRGILNDNTKLKLLTPYDDFELKTRMLNDDTKLKKLTPFMENQMVIGKLNDNTKLKQLTPGHMEK